MAIDDFSEGMPTKPGKEWRITTPESVDMLKLLEGEMALSAMARALGWEITEVKKPKETELTNAEILATSKETFGTEAYGEFALGFLDWVRSGAKASVGTIGDIHHVNFAYSVFHNRFPAFQERLPVKQYASEGDIKRAIKDGFDEMQFPFTHKVHFSQKYRYRFDHPSYGTGFHVATVVPDILTRERMTAFLQKPIKEGGVAPADHKLHGVIGRAFDVLCMASGVKETVDPTETEAKYEPIPYHEFLTFAEQNGVSKGKLQTLRRKIENAFYGQLFSAEAQSWGEVVAEGKPQFYHSATGDGFRAIYLDTISPSTLQVVSDSYERLSPELATILELYKIEA